eukprot:8456463-Heterocapsa_arctica.AAC.1
MGDLPGGHFGGLYGTLFLRCSRVRRAHYQQQRERDRGDLGGPARLDVPSDLLRFLARRFVHPGLIVLLFRSG